MLVSTNVDHRALFGHGARGRGRRAARVRRGRPRLAPARRCWSGCSGSLGGACSGSASARRSATPTSCWPGWVAEWRPAGDGRRTRDAAPAPNRGRAPPSGDVTLDYVGSVANAATVIAALHGGEKRLVFCDSRAQAEQLAIELRAREITTFVSHSSLSAEERRRSEQAFAEARDCVVVATSTLELGIDVGDLDRVIQIDAPRTVASFLQRLGRTGRRPGTTRNTLFLATRDDAFLQAAGLLRLWQAGFVEPVVPPPEPPAHHRPAAARARAAGGSLRAQRLALVVGRPAGHGRGTGGARLPDRGGLPRVRRGPALHRAGRRAALRPSTLHGPDRGVHRRPRAEGPARASRGRQRVADVADAAAARGRSPAFWRWPGGRGSSRTSTGGGASSTSHRTRVEGAAGGPAAVAWGWAGSWRSPCARCCSGKSRECRCPGAGSRHWSGCG